MATVPRTLSVLALSAALLVVVFTFGAGPGTSQAIAPESVVAVMGDLGSTMNTERNIDRATAAGAQGLIGLGDYTYDASLRGWNAVVDPLTSRGAWFAVGNHDDINTFRSRMPGGTPAWSTLLGGVRVIAINTQDRIDTGTTQHTWFVGELGREPASHLKVVVMHKPWWLGAGARHPGWEFPGNGGTMDSLLKQHGVDAVFASHEHNYQRTSRNQIPYAIVGTGGHSLYPVAGSDPATVVSCSCYGHVLLTLGATQLAVRFVDVNGATKDTYTTGGPTTTTTPFTASFSNVRGNNWWIESDVNANKALAGVDARVNTGAWIPLEHKDWGSWAKSINAPTGSKVEFRARATTGETAQSVIYTWPPA